MRLRIPRSTFALAAAGTLLAVGPALGQAATEFQGGGFLYDFTSACSSVFAVGSTVQATARMRPAGLSGNSPTDTILNIFLNNFAMHHRFVPAAVSQWATVSGSGFVGGGFASSGTPTPRFRFTPTPSGTVLGSDAGQALHIVGQFDNLLYLPNCQARVNLWLYRR